MSIGVRNRISGKRTRVKGSNYSSPEYIKSHAASEAKAKLQQEEEEREREAALSELTSRDKILLGV